MRLTGNGGIGILISALLITAGCGSDPEPVAQGPARSARPAADLVLRNGSIYTVGGDPRWVEAVAIRGGTIRYAGGNDGVQEWITPRTRVVDLGGRFVLPAFQDAHVHPFASGVEYQQCPLFDLSTPDQYAEAVRRCAEADPEAPWIIGTGWLLSAFPPEGIPDKSLLDAVVPDRPVILDSADGHTSWANSRAMEIAGITLDTPDPPDGRIDRDPQTGEPVGSFQETARELVKRHVPPPGREALDEGLRWAVARMNSLGITGWQDAVGIYEDQVELLESYHRLDRAGDLTAHVIANLRWNNGAGLNQTESLKQAREEYSGGNVNAGTVKIFLDGVVEAQTAAMIDPYTDRPGFRSKLQVPAAILNDAVTRLDAGGFQVHIHAIGDAAVRAALDAFEHARTANGDTDNRHHIAHVQFIHPDDRARFAALNATANFQPLWAFADEYIVDLTIPRVGPERTRWIYPIGSVIDAGGRVVFGSDWSVSSVNPLEGIEVAITRMGPGGETDEPFIPEERISIEDAVAAYTINAAHVNHLDNSTGSIEAGKRADLIVLDRNLFEIDPSAISEARVLLTLFGGEPVHGSLEDAGGP